MRCCGCRSLIEGKAGARSPVEVWCRYVSTLGGAVVRRRAAPVATLPVDGPGHLLLRFGNEQNGQQFTDSLRRTTQDLPRFQLREGPDNSRVAALEVGIWNKLCEEGQLSEALEALDLLVHRGSYVPTYSLYRALRRCVAEKDAVAGSEFHGLTIEIGYESSTFLASHIIRMYISHGRLEEATHSLKTWAVADTSVWNFIILANAERGNATQVIALYKRMQELGLKPSTYIHVAVLRASASVGDLEFGEQVHADIVRSKAELNVFVGSSLIDMYAKCGSVEDARKVFDSVPGRDVVTWNAMIAGYAQHGLCHQALALYASMQQEGIIPADRITFVCLLKVCGSTGALQEGKELHAQIKGRGLESDAIIGNSLVDMYAKCGNLGDARKVFDRLSAKDVVTWNTMLSGYANQELGKEALFLYESMQLDRRVRSDRVTFLCVLKACASAGALCTGELVHRQIEERGLETDVVVGSSLIDMYSKCGSLQTARRLFDSLPSRNVITWNAMLTGCVQHMLFGDVFSLYADMQKEGATPADHVTYVCLLKACSNTGALHQGKHVHFEIQERGMESNLILGNSLVEMYAKCGSLKDARRVFDNLQAKDVVSWTTMITGYAQHGLGMEALTLYTSMQQDGMSPVDCATFACLLKACAAVSALPEGQELHRQIQEAGLETDVHIQKCLLDMYVKCNSLEDARRILDKLQAEDHPVSATSMITGYAKQGSLVDARSVFDRLQAKDLVAWTAMIAAYAQHGLGQEALALYATMKLEGITSADPVLYSCLLKACASVGALQQGMQLQSEIKDSGLEANVAVGGSLVDMYSKCGRMEDARQLFDRMPTKDVVTWNALLNGYAQGNEGKMALKCFQEMEQNGVVPDDTTFLCLLVACSHQGLVEEGLHYFQTMLEKHGIKPSEYHRNVMVDLLGRSGHLETAENMLQSMPFESDAVGWRALLSACKSHGDLARGRRCFDHLVRLQPQDAAPYVLFAGICANAGRWGDAKRIEYSRRSAGACKKPARAWIEVNSQVRTFTVGEEGDDVSSKLRSVNTLLEDSRGHLEMVTKSEAGGKEDALCGHAEKLALAYGLLNTSDGTPLLVTKNLRMCGDCHSGTKVMSKIENREIVVRDAHRVHRFVNGVCSCGDVH